MSSTSDSSADSSCPPPNPIYIMLKDMKKGQEGKSLREITAELCTKLSSKQLATVEQYTSKYRLSQVEELFSSQPTEVVCTIVSSHVFVRRDELCVPAEIGLVNVSFRDGITGWYHSLFDSRKENILISDVPSICDSSNEHGILIESVGEVDLVNVLHEIHHIVHPGSGQHSDVGWVFISDDEFIQSRDVLLWCQARSDQLKLDLVWNVRCLPLSSVCKHLANRFSMQPFNIDQVMCHFTAEKDNKSHQICNYHSSVSSPRNVHCASLRAHHYAQMLYEMFERPFKQLPRYSTNLCN